VTFTRRDVLTVVVLLIVVGLFMVALSLDPGARLEP
jgi:hypothetical protein